MIRLGAMVVPLEEQFRARRGLARHGVARHGGARRGLAGHG